MRYGHNNRVQATYFAAIPAWIVMHPGLTAQAVRVYAGLYLSGNFRDKVSEVSIRKLAATLGSSKSTVDRAIDELEKAGAIQSEAIFDGDGARTGTLYRLATDQPGVPPVEGSVPDMGQGLSHGRESFLAVSEEELSEDPTGPISHTGGTQRELFGAVQLAVGWEPPLTKQAQAQIGLAAKGLLAVGASVEDVAAFAVRYHAHWPRLDLTPTAMLKYWSAPMEPEQPRRGVTAADRAIQRAMMERSRNGHARGTDDGWAAGRELPESSDWGGDDS